MIELLLYTLIVFAVGLTVGFWLSLWKLRNV